MSWEAPLHGLTIDHYLHLTTFILLARPHDIQIYSMHVLCLIFWRVLLLNSIL